MSLRRTIHYWLYPERPVSPSILLFAVALNDMAGKMARARALHYDTYGYCHACADPWPCLTFLELSP